MYVRSGPLNGQCKIRNTTQDNIYINIGKKNNNKKIKSKIYNKIKCAIQYTVDLINNNIKRDVQEECANRLYRVYTVHIAAIRMMENSQIKSNQITFIVTSPQHKCLGE